ncbi:MAG: phage virion morphogenesis protein [Bacteroidetes bacterium]|nr:phage virion morphogenesis protein [Bacteroidota bacterium]
MTSGKFINIWKQKLPLYLKMRRTLADDASRMALNEFKDNFRKQGYMNAGSVFIPWKAIKSGKKSRVFGKNSSVRILMGKSPRLKASLHKKPTYATARVVTDKPYAKIHNEGGVIHRIYVRHTKRRVK